MAVDRYEIILLLFHRVAVRLDSCVVTSRGCPSTCLGRVGAWVVVSLQVSLADWLHG